MGRTRGSGCNRNSVEISVPGMCTVRVPCVRRRSVSGGQHRYSLWMSCEVSGNASGGLRAHKHRHGRRMQV